MAYHGYAVVNVSWNLPLWRTINCKSNSFNCFHCHDRLINIMEIIISEKKGPIGHTLYQLTLMNDITQVNEWHGSPMKDIKRVQNNIVFTLNRNTKSTVYWIGYNEWAHIVFIIQHFALFVIWLSPGPSRLYLIDVIVANDRAKASMKLCPSSSTPKVWYM